MIFSKIKDMYITLNIKSRERINFSYRNFKNLLPLRLLLVDGKGNLKYDYLECEFVEREYFYITLSYLGMGI